MEYADWVSKSGNLLIISFSPLIENALLSASPSPAISEYSKVSFESGSLLLGIAMTLYMSMPSLIEEFER